MNNQVKLALAMIVKGDDGEADALNRCLSFVSKDVDGIFITITHKPGEAINEKTVEIAKAYGAVISHFEWVNDFAKARNFNFAQVPKDFDYILWLDADDGLRGSENLKPTIEKHPDVDVFIFNYLYAFDQWKNPIVVHQKGQVVKNDGCIEWSGALHEHFKPMRELSQFLVQGIDRLHLTTDERVDANKQRNFEVATAQAQNEPNDPRAYWNLGNSAYGLGKLNEAIQAFDKFLALSQSDDEKYIVRLRRAEAFYQLGNVPQAMDECRYGIGTKPLYPDAYHLLGTFYFNQHKFKEALDMYMQGIVKKAPQYEIIVHNPRDYDYTPLMNMAKTYFNLNLPLQAMDCLKQCAKIYPKDNSIKDLIKMMEPEVKKFNKMLKHLSPLKKMSDRLFEEQLSDGERSLIKNQLMQGLNALPADIQNLPAVCNIRNVNFVKTDSSGKDLAIFCGYTEEEWNPDTIAKKGIGGSEEAVYHLSKLLVNRGWNVTVYNNCGHKEKIYDGVHYKPFWAYNYRDKQDVTVLWRTLKPLDWDMNSAKVYVDLHDVMPPGEFTEKRVTKITKIMVKSQFHRSLFPNVPDDKFIVIPNGIDSEVFKSDEVRDPMLMINTSSADRSLSSLLDIYEMVKKEVPDAKLKWAYGWGVMETAHRDNPEVMAWIQTMKDRMKDLGVEELGRINHADIAKLYKSANIFAYPSEFAEIDCISLTKAMAAGAIPVTTDFAAMGEKIKGEVHSNKTKDNWADPAGTFDFSVKDPAMKQELAHRMIQILKNPPTEESRQIIRGFAQERYDWNTIANEWNKELIK